jgi:transposase
MLASDRQWQLPEDHLAWFVVDVVDELDLAGFDESYRLDGRGAAAYAPAMMVALWLYAYCVGEQSSRRIERRCVEDVAFRVVAANQRPNHCTIARFRQRHAEALCGLFAQVLACCAAAGPSATSAPMPTASPVREKPATDFGGLGVTKRRVCGVVVG